MKIKRGALVVQLLSHTWLLATTWTAACQASLSFTVSLSLHKLMSIELVISPNHLILCHPLLLLSLISPSIRLFSNESVLRIRWPKDWSFSFSISPSKEYSGLISFRIDCFYFISFISLLSKALSESSPAQQFKSTNSLVLSLLHSPTMTSIHDHRKNHSLD